MIPSAPRIKIGKLVWQLSSLHDQGRSRCLYRTHKVNLRRRLTAPRSASSDGLDESGAATGGIKKRLVARRFLRNSTAHETAMTERIFGRNEVKEVLASSRSAINQLVVRFSIWISNFARHWVCYLFGQHYGVCISFYWMTRFQKFKLNRQIEENSNWHLLMLSQEALCSIVEGKVVEMFNQLHWTKHLRQVPKREVCRDLMKGWLVEETTWQRLEKSAEWKRISVEQKVL